MGSGRRGRQRVAPEWWLPGSGKVFRLLFWIHIDGAIGLVIVSAPFALGIAWIANRTAMRMAVYVTLLYLLIGPILYLPFSWNAPSFDMFVTWGADVAKQLVCLPLLSLGFSAILKKHRAANKVTDRDTPISD